MRSFFYSIILLFLLLENNYAQLIGAAYLSGQTNHSGIKVKFLSNGGTAVTDSTTTSPTGNFSINITGGSYKVVYSKAGYLDINYNGGAAVILTNTVSLASQTLNVGNQVIVSGNVSGLWTNNNVYVVNGDLTVPLGQTLTIQPGTNIRFNYTFSLTTNGVILAIGNSSMPIIFTSNLTNPSAGDWYGINVFNSNSKFVSCKFNYSKLCLNVANCSPLISNNDFSYFLWSGLYGMQSSAIITNNSFHDFTAATGAIDWYGPSTSTISCNKIFNGTGTGIRPFANALVENNEIFNISGYAMSFQYGGAMVKNNYLHNCSYGMYIGNNVTPEPTPQIINNTIINNTYEGIDLQGFYSNPKIINNIISGNNQGIRRTGSASSITDIQNNLVWNNTNGNYINLLTPSIGQTVSTNSNGDAVDSYFNLSQDPIFASVPNLSISSPCLNAGNSIYSSNIGYNLSSCFPGLLSVRKTEMNNNDVKVYPNPSTGNLLVEINNFHSSANIELYNLIGQKSFEKTLTENISTLDFKFMEKGIYFIVIREKDGKVSTKKIVLK